MKRHASGGANHHTMETPVKSFSNVTDLVLKGGGQISINEDGTIQGAKDATQSGGTLTVHGESGGSVCFGDGNVVAFNGGAIDCMSIGGGVVASDISGGCIVAGNRVFYPSSKRGNIVTINGRRVDLSKLDTLAADEKDAEEPTPVLRLEKGCCIKSVAIKGAASFAAVPLNFAGNVFNVSIAGSGDVDLPAKCFVSLNASIAGSGDVRGFSASADSAMLSIAGSGDIRGLHVYGSAIVNVMGSGDVSITADNPSSVVENQAGSGRIRVRRR